MSTPTHTMCKPRPLANTLCPGGRGGRFMMFSSAFSYDNEMAGKPSETKLIHKIWMGSSATGKPIIGPTSNVSNSPELVVIRYLMNLRMLSYTLRPSRTAFTMVEKLSSSKIMWAASLETSVPVMPMAMPMFALFSEGASFTPSPVMAT